MTEKPLFSWDRVLSCGLGIPFKIAFGWRRLYFTAKARAMFAEDIPLARRQFPDGTVPVNTEACAKGWLAWYEKATAEHASYVEDAYRILCARTDTITALRAEVARLQHAVACHVEEAVRLREALSDAAMAFQGRTPIAALGIIATALRSQPADEPAQRTCEDRETI